MMKKRSSKKQQYFETINHPNYSVISNSPFKKPLKRDNTVTHFNKSKPTLQLPKIFPIANLLRHKRYLQSILIEGDTSFNLVGTKFQHRMSKQKKSHQNSQQSPELKIQKLLNQKSESRTNNFLQEILGNSGFNSIAFQRNQKIKVYVEEGNNSRLIKELMRRRNYLKMVGSKKEANIVWTQFCDWQQANIGSSFMEVNKSKQRGLYGQKEQIPSERFREQSYKTNRAKEILIDELNMHNHLKNHSEISDKKSLFKNIKKYCKMEKIDQQEIIPKTYHLDEDQSNLPQNICQKQSIWIVKPGQDTNRGTGITIQEGRANIIKAVKELNSIGKTSLVQQYIDPLLYKNRKFDIRCYALVTSSCGNLKAYWYKQGYLRTCCKEFNYDPANIYGHLTNDAVQKKHKDYGKYQPCNKLSFSELETFLKSKDFSYDAITDRMKHLALISIRSAEDKLKGDKNIFCFEIFGYDFLIDSKGKVWLIQINTNPCLQFSGSLLSRIIWHMVQNSFAIALDPFSMKLTGCHGNSRQKGNRIYQDNKFQCII